MMWDFEPIRKYGQVGLDAVVFYTPKVLIAVVLGIVGWKLAKVVSTLVHKALANKRVDPSLRPFLGSLIDAVIKVGLAVTLVSYLGIPTASFVAVIGAAGLAIGLALSGTLQNFAGGVILLLIRPFRVGDTIKAQGFNGKVHEIQIFQTTLLTPDNLTIFIPNGKLLNESITNFSSQATRRVDLVFGIGYEDSIDQAREVLLRLIGEDQRVLADPAPAIVVQELGESTVDLKAGFWVATSDHYKVSCEIRERVKKAFDQEGISFPFPQCDYHIVQPDPKDLSPAN